MKKILILMATYNGELYLEEQLKSLFNQENFEVEVLVRDDGSTDKTKLILESWSKQTTLKWYSGEHLSAKYAFYDLMLHALNYDAEYFAFCDQDDVWDNNKLAIAVRKLKTISQNIPGLYYCGQRLVDENLNLLSIHNLNKKRSEYARFMLNDAAGCTQVFNRALLTKVTRYKPSYLLMHDAWMVKVCLSIGGKMFVDCDAHIAYRQHASNAIGLKNDYKSKFIRAKKYIYEQNVELQVKELKRGYYQEMLPDYKEIVENILNYKNNIFCKLKLLNMSKFNFGNCGIQMVYFIKIIINKL